MRCVGGLIVSMTLCYELNIELISIELNSSLLPLLLCAMHEVSGSLHPSKTMAQRTQNASLQHSCFTR